MEYFKHDKKGAQVLHAALGWGLDLLYLSPLVDVYPDNPIRGGIPLMFPQFGDSGPLRKHGFVRDLQWNLIAETQDAGGKNLSYVLDIKATDFPEWPFDAALKFDVRLSLQMLSIGLSVQNTGAQAFTFTGGFHPYFAISSRKDIMLNGLEGLPFKDSFPGDNAYELNSDALVERQYMGNADIRFYNGSHWLKITASGFDSWMVWNPGSVGASRISDLPDKDWDRFICIEPIILAEPKTLSPGDAFKGEMMVSVG
jgi:glucose-6-phosphate 1-epimerase